MGALWHVKIQGDFFQSKKLYLCYTIHLGKPSMQKSHKTADIFRMGGGGAQPHSIAFGDVFPNIIEAILVDEISTK